MKLHWSPKSPFVRKVMIVAHETGTESRFERVRTVVAMTQINPAIMGDNPLGKIPTLVLDDGRSIYDSLTICEYLDRLSGTPRMFPEDSEARWDALTRHALGDGLTDALILWRNELNRPREKQLDSLLSALETKVTAGLEVLERDAGRLEDLPFDIGHAAIGAALSYMDFRFSDFDWRNGRPALAAWHRSFELRPSAQATAIVDG
jgi:glutathione S-transferase